MPGRTLVARLSGRKDATLPGLVVRTTTGLRREKGAITISAGVSEVAARVVRQRSTGTRGAAAKSAGGYVTDRRNGDTA